MTQCCHREQHVNDWGGRLGIIWKVIYCDVAIEFRKPRGTPFMNSIQVVREQAINENSLRSGLFLRKYVSIKQVSNE